VRTHGPFLREVSPSTRRSLSGEHLTRGWLTWRRYLVVSGFSVYEVRSWHFSDMARCLTYVRSALKSGRIANAVVITKSSVSTPQRSADHHRGYPRGGGPRWRADRPYHVALQDSYIRAHWDEIYALCRLNSLPFNSTGETIQNDGVWKVYEFTWQMDAILFWDRFNGRWLRGTEFHYPERPENLPSLKPLENWPKFNPRDAR
jgi:hypothetical protein